MPRSTGKALARTRMQFLSEPRQAAFGAAPRDGTLGLDTCSKGQRKLRALLALGMFNRPGAWQPFSGAAAWGLHTLIAYDIIVSAQFGRLVFITGVPHNVAPYLLPRPHGVTRLPGLRLKEFLGPRTYLAHHLPTGAELVITGNRSGTWHGAPRPLSGRDFRTISEPLTEAERLQLAQVPEMSDEAERLLAGLVCRIAARDPHDRWAIGNWFSDPLERPSRHHGSASDRYEKQLSGSGHRWTLRWNGFPPADDVAASLTSAPVGIPGAVSRTVGDQVEVGLGQAALRLTAQCHLARQKAETAP